MDTASSDLLGTKPIYLSRRKPLKAVNLLLPPGISTFFVERLDKNHIRFLVRSSEITRLSVKAKKLEAANQTKTKKQKSDILKPSN